MAKNSRRKRSVILALDVSSSSTGYAVLREGRWNKSGASYGMIVLPKKLSVSQRLVAFRDEIQALIRRVKPTSVVIEDVFRGPNVATMKLLARFNGVAIEISRRQVRKDPTVVLAVAARAALGCGRKKEHAFSYVCERYSLDWSFKKMNDVTDALVLALYQHQLL